MKKPNSRKARKRKEDMAEILFAIVFALICTALLVGAIIVGPYFQMLFN